MRHARRDEGKNSLVLKIMIGVLLVIVAILGVIAFNKGNNTPTEEPDYINKNTENSQKTEESEADPVYDTETFVIFGVDSHENKLDAGTRSDSIMLVCVNHDLSQVNIVSILRDTMVEIEGHGYEKLTHAYYYGGSELALDTLNTNLDLDIKKYATFNFNSAGDIIDELGGIEMAITADETKYINGYINDVNEVRGTSSKHIYQAGTYTLDGTQAVAYSRIRYTEGADLKRTDRQRTVLFKMFQKVKAMGTEDRIAFAEKFMDEIKTNYSTDRMTSLLYCMSQYEVKEMEAFPKVYYDGLIDEVWYEVPVTLIDMNRELHEALWMGEDYNPSKKVEEISAVLEGKVDGPNMNLHTETE